MANELILTAEVAKLEVKKGTRVFNKYAAIEDGAAALLAGPFYPLLHVQSLITCPEDN